MSTNEIIATVVSCILVPLISWAIGEFTAWIKSKRENETLDKLLDIAEKSVIKAVKEIMQTYVDSLKKGGSFNEEEQKCALVKAKNKARDLMGSAAYKAIAAVYENSDEWITSTIEATISDIKAKNGIEAVING